MDLIYKLLGWTTIVDRSPAAICYTVHKLLGPAKIHQVIDDFTTCNIDAVCRSANIKIDRQTLNMIDDDLQRFGALYIHDRYRGIMVITKTPDLPKNMICVAIN